MLLKLEAKTPYSGWYSCNLVVVVVVVVVCFVAVIAFALALASVIYSLVVKY